MNQIPPTASTERGSGKIPVYELCKMESVLYNVLLCIKNSARVPGRLHYSYAGILPDHLIMFAVGGVCRILVSLFLPCAQYAQKGYAIGLAGKTSTFVVGYYN